MKLNDRSKIPRFFSYLITEGWLENANWAKQPKLQENINLLLIMARGHGCGS